MKKIYILWGLLACMALFTSCYEEDTLTPTEGGIELRFKVPQGNNSWDDDIAQIYEDYNVYLIYKICKGLILIAAGQAYHMVVATKAKAV